MRTILLLAASMLLASCDLVGALNSSDEKIVYRTETGKAYHDRDCGTIANSNPIYSLTVAEAQSLGLTACKVCKP